LFTKTKICIIVAKHLFPTPPHEITERGSISPTSNPCPTIINKFQQKGEEIKEKKAGELGLKLFE
jgi:hypothetical protein